MKLIILAMYFVFCSSLWCAPLVTNLTASQRTDAAKQVDIYFNVSNNIPMTISLLASNDGGVTWCLSCNHITGDVGANISPGNGKHIVWDVLIEHPNIVYDQVKFKVLAYDGQTPPIPDNFVLVPGGTFTMGDTRGGGGDISALPTHSITLNSFYIGKYEVTQAEYSQYLQPGTSWKSWYGLGDNYPAYYVSWFAAMKYCNLRSMAEGLTPVYNISGSTDPANWGAIPTTINSTWNATLCDWNANGYRLPTEAEWECAARSASNIPDYLYSGSDEVSAVAWYIDNSGLPSSTKPVGTKTPNDLNIYDMSGNVWEWCWDWISSNYYSVSPSNSPTGPTNGLHRVLRGGERTSDAAYCRVSFRYYDSPHKYFNPYGHHIFGIRLCRSGL